ncbi:hypothetical protein [Leeuwenhoekiella sp. H156]|uniref:hypothetical protein n=1 Tax=Leeuwenhoekiella sp. H156 TaxID=3450128 RepID=UPI003FA4090D
MKIPETYTEFEDSLQTSKPPINWPESLKALWFMAKGDWEASHDIAQDLHTPMGSLTHAHLHRVEGDDWNAKYWYRKAGRTYTDIPFEEELRKLIEEALQGTS